MPAPRSRTGLHQLTPLPQSFYARDARLVAADLIGCYLVSLVRQKPQLLVAQIVETEAYLAGDPASHSYRGPTARNAAMFGRPGRAYVYFVYGNHHCLNVVSGAEGSGAAVLLRAAVPLSGLAAMAANRGLALPRRSARTGSVQTTDNARPARALRELCNGPGKLAQAFALSRASHDGCSLAGDDDAQLLLTRSAPDAIARGEQLAAGGGIRAFDPGEVAVVQDRRVGISRARDALWRYLAADNAFVSRKPGPAARALDHATDYAMDHVPALNLPPEMIS